MFDFNKPKIEITEMSDDKKYGQLCCRTAGAWLWYYSGQLPEKNHAVLSAGCCSKPGKN